MTYVLMSLPFLAIAVAAAWAWRPRERSARRRRLVATLIAALILVVLTAVFDSLIVATGIVAYDDAHRIGLAIGLAPIEDFLYPIAGVLLLPALFDRVARRRTSRRSVAERTGADR
ncbi:lycopene cyclase domain-containing protein [Agromyces flavus]|uniref:Lycopene cyclase domain-containing protein n=1 Tax=Agromyces flavus TaxID=589382 RepID=A0A1H1SFR2_9MICO|nr:lycopene cyclase domain-containing protein [Agromyces flavus]MCP2369012.1 lycopene cyclase domain-containing protein [Agromyces flavus]SDS46920.1 lycopene cyclase domain-containing protein [Agromyces flavus]